MWWRQQHRTYVVLLLTAMALTIGLVLVRNSVGTWAHPIVWVTIVVAILSWLAVQVESEGLIL